MRRVGIHPRQNLEKKLTDAGFVFFKDYYTETAAYEFTAAEIDRIDLATASVFEMCCQAIREIIEKDLFHEFFIPERFIPLIKTSWEEDFCSFYGRLDLAVNKDCTEIKLLEFNADCPTSLLEASVIQWQWLQEFNPDHDQFNSIHEKLLSQIEACKPWLSGDKKLWFTAVSDSAEDFMTVSYIRDLAAQSGLETEYVDINKLGLDRGGSFCALVDGEVQPVENIFKLYPYEWMFHEEFGQNLDLETTWIEPFYKSLLSNKMLLVLLYRMFPESPYILPAYFNTACGMESYVKKPVFSREGSNVTILHKDQLLQQTEGEYGEEGFIFQQYSALPDFEGYRPVIGSWLIGGETAGIGIKETQQYIHDNMSEFCPHYFINQ